MRNLFYGVLIVIGLSFALHYSGIPLLQGYGEVSAADLPANITPLPPEALKQTIERSGNNYSLLVVYASWCPYCKSYLETINRMHIEKKQEHPVTVISVNSNPKTLSTFLKNKPELQFKTHMITGPSTNLAKIISDYGGQFKGGIPYTAILQNGKIVGQIPGYVSFEDMIKILNKR